ncbi:MAG: transglutaminase-like cysteine peptidase [Gallionella sp.]|nr:transglutaminase-like cysteine peptidase [Gallionella sp.]
MTFWLAALLFLHWSIVSALDFNQLLTALKRYGGQPYIFENWQSTLNKSRSLPEPEKLIRLNEFFNRNIQSNDDQVIWGQSDYWATPMETLAKGSGDCEDFSIAKYFSLVHAGIPVEKLRLVYVKARIGGPRSDITQAHMVLAYYATPDAEPLVLDSLITDIRPASRRIDLLPIFSFNSQGIWGTATSNNAPASTSKLSRWQTLLSRAKAEGFE